MEHDATCIQSQSSFTVVILYHFNPLTERYMFDLQKKAGQFCSVSTKDPFSARRAAARIVHLVGSFSLE